MCVICRKRFPMNQLIRARSINNRLDPVAFQGQHLCRPTQKKGRSVWLCSKISCIEQLPKRTKQLRKSLQAHTSVALFRERLQQKLITLCTVVLRKAHQSGQLNLINKAAVDSYELSNQTLESILPANLVTKLLTVDYVEKAVTLRSGKWSRRAKKILLTLEQLQGTNAPAADGSAIVFLKRVPKPHAIG